MSEIEGLRRQVRVLHVLHLSEWTLIVLCGVLIAYLMYGRVSERGLLSDLFWIRSVAVGCGVAFGLGYSLVHFLHLRSYEGYKQYFVEATTLIDRRAADHAYEAPVSRELDMLVRQHKAYVEPKLYTGVRGLRINIALGFGLVVATIVLTQTP